jgi:hypothetical protein
MLTDGLYIVKFSTPMGSGAGVVILTSGKLRGGDSAIVYSGSYSQDGDQFTAEVKTFRHTNGMPSVFGAADRVSMTLKGKSLNDAATCTGQAAGVAFQAELHRATD